MDPKTLDQLIDAVSRPAGLCFADGLAVLDPQKTSLLTCLSAAGHFREKHFARTVTVHILNNVQNGLCPEDCRYCAQSRSSSAPIETYPMKPAAEILAEAKAAYEQGAHRYCMVFSGTGPSDSRIETISRIVEDIKARYPIEVCVSPGVITEAHARTLKAAGLDRLNHNLNTTERFYSAICSTHSYQDRVATLQAAKKAGLAVCSGVIIGMGETEHDVVEMALRLREFQAESIPVNFYIPLPGAAIKTASGLTPEYCLRVLCLFRLINPQAEIRMAAGRELHLRSLEALGLYAANSLFLQGYLNARGTADTRTLQMIKDAGFTILSEVPLDQLLSGQPAVEKQALKTLNELRPCNLS
ncbi:MAG: biotin synthase BioB [Candidatus Omnitrophica bacterium]|nr:biotin synthase BioB [Candidatus Omnitrophota bacterium]